MVTSRTPQERPHSIAPLPRLLNFAELACGQHFTTALPLVGNLAAGPLQSEFTTGSLTDLQECAWLEIPAKFAGQNRFVVRIAGDSMEPTLHVGDYAVFAYHRTPRCDREIVIVADFSDGHGDANQVAIKRYRADSATHWHFTSDNPVHTTIQLTKSTNPYPILGIFVAKLA